jgi:hypothetical protein
LWSARAPGSWDWLRCDTCRHCASNKLGSGELGGLVEGLSGLRRLSLNKVAVNAAGLRQLTGQRGPTFPCLSRKSVPATAESSVAALLALRGLKHLALAPLPFLLVATLTSMLESCRRCAS